MSERSHGVVIETGPTVLPALEVRHPVWDINIDSIDPAARNLPHALHIGLPPFGGIWTHPYIFVAFRDPEGRATPKNSWIAGDFTLQPLWMILGQRMYSL